MVMLVPYLVTVPPTVPSTPLAVQETAAIASAATASVSAHPQIQFPEISPQFDSRSGPDIRLAQAITPASDGTGTVVTPEGNRIDISGGQRSADGANLFHSFEQFGLSAEQIANFLASPDIQNILGQISGGNVSVIDGLVQVSGGSANLYLINPAGIILGPNAALNLDGSFTATTADRLGFSDRWLEVMNPDNYADLVGTPNQWVFSAASPGSVLNLGDLGVNVGQSLTLAGGTVVNLGRLSAPEGTLTLLAVPGEQRVRISQDNQLLSLEVAPLVNPDGSLAITPLTLPELLTGSEGTIAAMRLITNPDGSVQLVDAPLALPTTAGTAIAAGSLDAAGVTGGQINLLGNQVAAIAADLNVSGDLGGGSVYLGGDAQGQDRLPAAAQILVSADSQIRADAIAAGDGGEVTLWGDRSTQFYGAISAQGGAAGGNGGQVEVSSPGGLAFEGTIDTRAPQGSPGTLLIDPVNIEIVASGGNTSSTTLGFSDAPDDAQIAVDLLNNASTSISLQATNDIRFSTDVAIAGFGINLTATANNNILVNGDITTNGSDVTLQADADGNGMGAVRSSPGTMIQAGGGDVTAAGAMLQLGSISSSTAGAPGQVSLTASGDITFETIDVSNISVGPGGSVALVAGGTVRGTNTLPFGATITAAGTSFVAAGSSGTVTIQHTGGPDNLPFQVGTNSSNGTAGAIRAGTISISDDSFPVLPTGGTAFLPGEDTGQPPNITITSVNAPPTLTLDAQPLVVPNNQPRTFTLADLNVTVSDRNNDNTILTVAAINSGTLLRNGVPIAPGDTLTLTDVLRYIPATAAASDPLTADALAPDALAADAQAAFTLVASDRVSQSAPVAVNVLVTPPLLTDPTLGPPTPLPLASPLTNEANLLVGVALTPSPWYEDLAILGSVLPEAPYLIDRTAPIRVIDGHLFIPDVSIWPPLGTGSQTTYMLIMGPEGPGGPDVPPTLGEAAAPPSGVDVAEAPDVTSPTVELPTGIQRCQDQLGPTTSNVNQAQAVYPSLIRCYQQNLAVATEQNNGQWVSYSLNNLATSFFVTGDYVQALQLHQQQLELAVAAQDRTQEGIALSGIGAAYGALGDYATAIDYYQRSLAVLPIETAPQWQALTYRNLGNAYFAQKDYGQAIKYQLASLDITRAIADPYGEMQTLGNLGHAYAIQGDFPQAVESYQQSLVLADALQNPLEKAQTLLGLSTAYAYQRDFAQSYRYGVESLDLTRSLGARLGEGIALTNVGNALISLERLPEAEQQLTAAVSVWESLRAGLGNNDSFKVSLFETQLAAYRNLQEVLVKQNRPEQALEISERSRARAFVELLARGNTRNPAGTVPPPSLEDIRQIARRQNTTLVEYTIVRDQFAETPYGDSVQVTVDPQDYRLYIWVVSPDGTVQFRQVQLDAPPFADQSIAELVAAARQALTGQRQDRGEALIAVERVAEPTDERTLERLYQLLVAPIAELLPADPNAKVAFIPQEQLFLLPFDALSDRSGQYLIQQHTLLTAPSIQVLALAAAAAPETPATVPDTALVVGNPSPMPSDYPDLPYAETEAVDIAALLGTDPLVGAAATEAAITAKLPTAQLIHLATHGRFDESQPLAGAIALAPDSPATDKASARDDGFLTAAEIMALPLQADLVVLSACDTGRGRITGDGVLGLSRAFMAAGANRVLVSLWQIPDQPTADLMVEFYRQRQTSADAVQALRQAKLQAIQDGRPITDWAAFTLMGD